METMLYVILGYALFIVLVARIFWYIGSRGAKEAKYNLMYKNFRTMLYDPYRPINRVSWKELNLHFTELEDMKWNIEKTDVLRGEFLKMYQPIIEEIEAEFDELMSELHEFDPSSIFVGE